MMNHFELISAVRAAGLVGQGGAGFPAHVKYAAKAETIIVNGCECEPLLAVDRFLLLHRAGDLLGAARLLAAETGASRVVVAVTRKHADILDALKAADISGVELAALPDIYPAGDEQTLVRLVTGRTVPPLGLPLAVGALVANVGTLLGAHDALAGRPVTAKVFTVTGEVARPANIEAPLGTSIVECIEACGGATVPNPVCILGGPLMGRVLDSPDGAVVTKTLSGVVLLPRDHILHRNARQKIHVMRRRAAAACIQCRMCTDLCPRYLNGQPFETHRVMRAFAAGAETTAEAARQALWCCECGICEHMACPMGLSPRRINIAVKNILRAGLSAPTAESPCEPRPFAPYRMTPTARLAARVGLGPYMILRPDGLELRAPSRVRIPLKQHIGAPALPVVATGDMVRVGDLLGEIPEGSLGARVHAGIAGRVTLENDAVVIERSPV